MQEKELQADIDELKALLEAAQRPYVKNAIKQEIIRLEEIVKKYRNEELERIKQEELQ